MSTTPITNETQHQFEQLFRRSRRHAYNLAYRLTGNAADAEDVTQDAYVRAWHHFDRYNANYSFEGWLVRILTNRALDLQRRKKRRPTLSMDALMQREGNQLFSHEFAAPDSDPQDILLKRIVNERLQRAIAALPKDYRTAILLCDVEQRSYQEIADMMRCAPGTVRSRIHRGRRMIRRTLENKNVSSEWRCSETIRRAA